MAVKAFGVKPQHEALSQSILRNETRVHPSDLEMQYEITFDGYVEIARLAFARSQYHPTDAEVINRATKKWNESIVQSHGEES